MTTKQINVASNQYSQCRRVLIRYFLIVAVFSKDFRTGKLCASDQSLRTGGRPSSDVNNRRGNGGCQQTLEHELAGHAGKPMRVRGRRNEGRSSKCLILDPDLNKPGGPNVHDRHHSVPETRDPFLPNLYKSMANSQYISTCSATGGSNDGPQCLLSAWRIKCYWNIPCGH